MASTNENEKKESGMGSCAHGGGQHHSSSGGHNGTHSRGLRFSNLVLIGFLAIVGFFLFTEHRAHLFGILPWLLLLACPLMHLFHGHGGHGGHSHGGNGSQENKENQKGVQS